MRKIEKDAKHHVYKLKGKKTYALCQSELKVGLEVDFYHVRPLEIVPNNVRFNDERGA